MELRIHVGPRGADTWTTALVDEDDLTRLLPWHWARQSRGYAWAWMKERNQQILLHRFIMDAPDGTDVDHRNGVRLDCRKANLRLCTAQQNCHNLTVLPAHNTSGVIGVTMTSNSHKWCAQIIHNGRSHWLGIHRTFEGAVAARREAELRLFGAFAPEKSCHT